MLVKEYLKIKQIRNRDCTFIVQKAVKDEHTPFYHNEYVGTPIHNISEWERSENFINNYIVIKFEHPPIDSTGTWHNWFKWGHINCAMVTTEKDLITHYGEKQGRDMIKYYDKKVREEMEKALK